TRDDERGLERRVAAIAQVARVPLFAHRHEYFSSRGLVYRGDDSAGISFSTSTLSELSSAGCRPSPIGGSVDVSASSFARSSSSWPGNWIDLIILTTASSLYSLSWTMSMS